MFTEEVWDTVRLLWIGWMKESEDKCNLAKLPKDILKYLIEYSVQN